MILKNINDITEEDLNMLKENGVMECKTLDYKEGEPLSENPCDEEKKEFYKDISSFANAEGGDIIYGISSDKGLPTDIEGFPCSNFDDLKLKLSSMIRTGIEPVITPLPEFWRIKLQNEKIVLIIRIQQSINAPHRVSFKGHNKFYIRVNNNKDEMSMEDIRNSFNLSLNITKRITNFRMDRLHKLIVGATPVSLSKKDGIYKSKLMIHLIPLKSFSSAQFIDINGDKNYKILKNKLIPIEVKYGEERFNLDGFLKFASTNEHNETFSYTQFFRNGIIEAVFGAVLSEAYNENEFPLDYIRDKTLKNVYKYLDLLNELSISPPVYVFLTFYDVKGISVLKAPSHAPKIDRNLIQLPEVVINKFVQNEDELKMLLKPMFDTLENALGNRAS